MPNFLKFLFQFNINCKYIRNLIFKLIITSLIVLVYFNSCDKNPANNSNLVAKYKVAFMSSRDGLDEIYIMDTDGSNQKRLTYEYDYCKLVGWTYDGKSIIYYTNSFSGTYKLYSLSISDNSIASLKLSETDGKLYYSSVSVSRNSAKIAYSTFISDLDSCYIYTVNSDGSKLKKILDFENYITAMQWTPDDSRIVFITSEMDIYIVNSDGTNLQRLTSTTIFITNLNMANFSDIVLLSFPENINSSSWDVLKLNLNTLQMTNLTNSDYFDYNPKWSPDDQKIAFISDRNQGEKDLFIMNSDGSELNNLTLQARIGSISWQPDGKKIFSNTITSNIASGELISIDLDSLKQNITFANENIKFLTDSSNSSFPICSPVKLND